MSALVLALVLGGCAHPLARPPTAQIVQMEPLLFAVQPGGHVAIIDAAQLFDAARGAYAQGRYSEAAAGFDRVAHEFAESNQAGPALYNAGLAWEAAGELVQAAARYEELAGRTRSCRDHCDDLFDALFRLGAADAARSDWPRAEQVYSEVIARAEATVSDRVEALGRRAECEFKRHDFDAAERTIRSQQALVRANETVERLDTDFFVAMGAFYLARIAQEDARVMPLRPGDAQLKHDLEAKATLLLTAQTRYLDTIRIKNPEWATAAGFQLGALYRQFYDDIVGAPIPPSLTGEARQVYLEEVRDKVSNLLRKAAAVHERNLLMAERVGVHNEWVTRSTSELEELRRLLVPGAARHPPSSEDVLQDAPPLPEKPRPRRLDDSIPPPAVL